MNIYMSSTCNKTSNNKYFYLPARMNDGRTFTDYRSSSTVDDMIRYSNNVMSSYDYRQFLISNANNIIKVNNDYTEQKVGNSKCDYKEVPFQTECNVNSSYSRCSMTNQNGIGIKNVAVNVVEKFTPNGMNLNASQFESAMNLEDS